MYPPTKNVSLCQVKKYKIDCVVQCIRKAPENFLRHKIPYKTWQKVVFLKFLKDYYHEFCESDIGEPQ